MTDIDELLSIIENPTRRRILEYLTREPSYPLQLSKELGISQQAVMKNLALMEQTGMLMSHPEESSMGPTRTVYAPSRQFTLMIDLHGNMFTTRLISTGIVDTGQSGSVDTEAAIERLKQLDSKIEELDRERASLLDERDSVMNAINSSIRDVEDPVKRKELYRQLDEMINEDTKEV
ncbi:MAG: helix-turn-helix domain-containing protein [Candidatus Methanomethylophilaceae archaeon]|nr:helix-turn-helix domain-containing protein [Candidatus Methanomethylophilaceae archaeon]